MVAVTALTTEVAPPPRIPSFAGLLPTLKAAGLVAETWEQAVSLAIGSGVFAAKWKGAVLTPETALELGGQSVLVPRPDAMEDVEEPVGLDEFINQVDVIYGKRFLDSFTFRGESIQEHRPIGCGDAAPWVPQCVAADAPAAAQIPKTISEQAEIVTQYPIQIQANDDCSTWAPDLDERKLRALENLRRHESNILAAELWTGSIAAANGWPNLSLAGSATPVGGGPLSVTVALGEIQQHLAAALGDGQAGLIYANRLVVQRWWANGDLYWLQNNGDMPYYSVNGYMTDIFGNLIISSGGFTGSDVAYGSGPIVVRLGDIEIIPGEWAGGAPALTRNNNFTVYAERYASYELDDCGIFSADIDLCAACTTPAS